MNNTKLAASNIGKKGAVIISRLYILLFILFLIALLYNHFQLINYKVPLDYNEAAMLTITETISSGGNPHSLESQPSNISLYPVLYNILVAPVSNVFGNVLPVHRTFAGIFIFASCLLLFFVVKKSGASTSNSFVATVLFYAALLFYSNPIASPTSLGLFCFLSSILIPWYFRFSNRSLTIALILGVLAFYAKQYFVAGLGYTALYLFLAVSKKRGLVFGGASLITFLTSLALVNQTSPYFLDNVIFSIKYAADLVVSNQIMLKQLYEYSMIYLPVLLIVIIQLTASLFGRLSAQKINVSASEGRPLVRLAGLNDPLLRTAPDYFWYCLTCSLAIFIFGVGKNPGNHLSYLFQLISPFLLVITFNNMSRENRLTWLYQLLALLALYTNYNMLSHDYTLKKYGNWQRIEEMISEANNIYTPPSLLGQALDIGSEIHLNGHTNYFGFAKDKPSFFKKKNSKETVEYLWNQYISELYSKIEAQEFDLVILDQWTSIPGPPPDSPNNLDGKSWLAKHYRLRDKMPIFLANRPGGGRYAIQIWEPMPKPSPHETAPSREDR